MMNDPLSDELHRWFAGPSAGAVGASTGSLRLTPLSVGSVADGTTVLLVHDEAGQRRAVVLLSAPASPDLVRRAMSRASEAKAALGPSHGARFLEPLAEGRVQGLSYAVLPYCSPLSGIHSVWMLQRRLLRPVLLDWLVSITALTAREVESGDIRSSFEAPLRHLASMSQLSEDLRAAAEGGAQRLHDRTWTPRHVLMHGDLWRGNILVRRAAGALDWLCWRDRVVITDWPGAQPRGYAIYDLIRLADSLRLTPRQLRCEVARHCRLLGCELSDAAFHLLAALGHLGMNLEHFPLPRYVQLAQASHARLQRIFD